MPLTGRAKRFFDTHVSRHGYLSSSFKMRLFEAHNRNEVSGRELIELGKRVKLHVADLHGKPGYEEAKLRLAELERQAAKMKPRQAVAHLVSKLLQINRFELPPQTAGTKRIQIAVPIHVHGRLKQLAELQHETGGFLLYTIRKHSDREVWQVHGFFPLGKGGTHEVHSDPAHVMLANKLLAHLRSISPRVAWDFIKVHTHCRGTGPFWFDKFSRQDIDAIADEVGENSRYTSMMYSPTHELVAGHSSHRYEVIRVASTVQHQENTRNLETVFRRIAKQQRVKVLEL